MTKAASVVIWLFASVSAHAVVDEGVVTSVDGKGGLVVRTREGLMELQAHGDLMADELKFKPPRWPHRYRDVKPGDYISFSWQRNAVTGKRIVESIGIKKRGG